MRKIKFRAWRKDFKEMYYSDFVVKFTGTILWRTPEYGYDTLLGTYKAIPMQYTGLMDKNGKEIYEGDIISVYDMNRGCLECDLIDSDECKNHTEECENYICKQEVKWNSYTGYACTEDTGEFCPLLGSEELELVVIGNIYQNPELLS